ncbi:MAG: mandelate racemase/muconate lactonizing enzyme family protein [Saprospiraceae bacterium]
MKIKAIRAWYKKMALTKPYTIAYNTMSDVSIAFLEIELENGILGYGTGSPAEDVVGESTAQTVRNLQSDFVQGLIGRDIRHFQQLIFECRHHFVHLPGTQAALDIALHDAFCKLIGVPVCDFYGRKIDSLPTSVTIGIKNTQETLEEAREYARLGFRILKVKTGLDVNNDIERIIRLHEEFGRRFTVRVDANQGYDLANLKDFLAKTSTAKVELVEQPLPVGQEDELLGLSREERKIIAGDESLKDARAALDFATAEGPFGIYNIKLMKCGGLAGAKEIATIAENSGIELFWGCNDESILSIAAALHVAYSCPNTRYIDLDGSLDLAEDLVSGGFSIEDGFMKINAKPGFGVEAIDYGKA